MKRAIAVFFCLLICLPTRAAWVRGYLVDITGVASSPLITFDPQSTPLVGGGGVVLDVVRQVRPVNGYFSNYLAGGVYLARFSSGGEAVRVAVPADNNVYWFTNLIDLATFTYPNIYGAPSSRFLPGSGASFVTNNAGEWNESITMTFTPGVGSGESNAVVASATITIATNAGAGGRNFTPSVALASLSSNYLDAATLLLLTNNDASALATGTVPTARLGSGTANSSTFLRGDQTWATPIGAGDVTADTDLTNNLFLLGTGTTGIKSSGAANYISLLGLSGLYQGLDADLTDLADGSLTGSKVGSGIIGDNITTGTVDEARIDADILRDTEAALAYQPIDVDLTALANGGFSGSGPFIRASELTNALPIYCVDQVIGSDANTGRTPQDPWQTLARLSNTLDAVEIRLARGSNWREQLTLGSNTVVTAYGSGPRPVIDGSEIVTGWTLASGLSATYAVSNYVVTGGGVPSTIPVIEDGIIMIAATSLANCEATDGSFYSADTPAAGSTNSVFINPTGGTAPASNRKTYEVGKRNYAIVGGHNNSIKSLVTRNAMGNNGSIYLGRNVLLQDLMLENGTYHHVLIESGRLEDVTAWKASHYTGQSIPFVAYSITDGLSIEFIRCTVIGTSPTQLVADGFYGHTSNVDPNPGFAYAKFEDCLVTWSGGFGTISINTNAVQIFNRCKAIGTSTRGFALYGGTNILIDCEFQTSPEVPFAVNGRPVNILGGAGSRTYITGLKCSVPDTMGPYNISIGTSSAWLSVVDSIIGQGNTIGITAFGPTNITLSVSNCIIGSGEPYQFTAQAPTFTANSNCYTFPTAISFQWGSLPYTNWTQFLALVTPNETASITNNAQWIGWPINGDYRYSITSPAVTNYAGPGWHPSRRFATHPRLSEIPPYLPPNLSTGPWLEGSISATTNGLAPIAHSGSASDLSAGTVPTARLGSGTANSTTVLHGDNTWAVPAGGLSTTNNLIVGGGGVNIDPTNTFQINTPGLVRAVTVDTNGNTYLAGNLNAVTGTVATVNVSGSINGTSMALTGNVLAGKIIITNAAAGTSATWSNNAAGRMSTDKLRVRGAFDMFDLHDTGGAGLASGLIIQFYDNVGARQAYIYKEGGSGKLSIANEQAERPLAFNLGGADRLTLQYTTDGRAWFVLGTSNINFPSFRQNVIGGNNGVDLISGNGTQYTSNSFGVGKMMVGGLSSAATDALTVAGSISASETLYANNIYSTNDVSALTFTDRSRAPTSLKEAYEIVASMKSKDGHVDHSALSPKAWGTRTRTVTNSAPRFVNGKRTVAPQLGLVTEPDNTKRDLGMVISAQGLVIQDLQERLAALEKKSK